MSHGSAVTEQTACSFEWVPAEILNRIFDFLEKISQFRLRRVCSRWDAVLQSSTVLAKVKLDVDVLAPIPWHDVSDLRVHGLSRCLNATKLTRLTSPYTSHLIILSGNSSTKRSMLQLENGDPFPQMWIPDCFDCHERPADCMIPSLRNLRTVVYDHIAISYDHLGSVVSTVEQSNVRLVLRDVKITDISEILGVSSERSLVQLLKKPRLSANASFSVVIPNVTHLIPREKALKETFLWEIVQSHIHNEGLQWTSHADCCRC